MEGNRSAAQTCSSAARNDLRIVSHTRHERIQRVRQHYLGSTTAPGDERSIDPSYSYSSRSSEPQMTYSSPTISRRRSNQAFVDHRIG